MTCADRDTLCPGERGMPAYSLPTGEQRTMNLDRGAVLELLGAKLGELTPEIRKASVFILENPNEIGVSSIREIAGNAGVKPNTLVRLARQLGFDGYDEFREPFRNEIKQGNDFQDRARWLQTLAQGDRQSELYGDMASGSIRNIERTFAENEASKLKGAADAILAARKTLVLGIGIGHMLARNFAYLAGMILDDIRAIPNEGHHPMDDIGRAGPDDVLLAITFKPYRTEVVAAVDHAVDRGMTIIGVSDSPVSPIVTAANFPFIVGTRTPQFFTSTVAATALLETLTAFVVADAKPEAIERIERFHARRHSSGVYTEDGR